MLGWIHAAFGQAWGPLRLFDSFFFLSAVGFSVCALTTWIVLPRLWSLLPKDRGRAFAVNADQSVGKPVSAGLIFVSIFCVAALIFVPFGAVCLRTIPFVLAATLVGYFDDRRGGFTEYQLAAMDLLVALGAAIVICGFRDTAIWLPGWKGVLTLVPWFSIPIATGVIWLSINATNCSDGVDGVSGSLTATADYRILGGLLYTAIGNQGVAQHLNIPAQLREGGEIWAIMAFLMAGCVAGYLWYNAAPSAVLMGDSGSRPLGMLMGMLVVATGNPLFLLLVASVIVLNGATGLVTGRNSCLRFLGVRVLVGRPVFPLHDHCRKQLGWSNTQVLVRFMLLHLGLSAVLVTLALKVR